MGFVLLDAGLAAQVQAFLLRASRLEELLNANGNAAGGAGAKRFNSAHRDDAEKLYSEHADLLHRIFEQLLLQLPEGTGAVSMEDTKLLQAFCGRFRFLEEVHRESAYNDLGDPELSALGDLFEHEAGERERGILHMGLYVCQKLGQISSVEERESYAAGIRVLQQKGYLDCAMPDNDSGLWVFIVLTQKARELFA